MHEFIISVFSRYQSDFLRREGNAGERPRKPAIPNYAGETRSKTVYKEKQRKKVHKGISGGDGKKREFAGILTLDASRLDAQAQLKPGEREQVK